MYSALVAASTEKGRLFFEDLLREEQFSCIVTAADGAETRQVIHDNSFDLVLINAPLKDEYGQKLALEIVETTASGVILVTKADTEKTVSEKVEDYGVFVLKRPINRQLFGHALKLVIAFRRRVLGLTKENVKLQKKIEEIRLVDRAKCTLIQYLSMSEEQAHHYIERQAMDMRATKREIAESILKTYET